MEENGFEFKNAANQYIATIAGRYIFKFYYNLSIIIWSISANLIMTGHGAVIG